LLFRLSDVTERQKLVYSASAKIFGNRTFAGVTPTNIWLQRRIAPWSRE